MTFALTVLISVLLDHFVGEVSRWHPLVGFGLLARRIETFFYLRSNIYVKQERSLCSSDQEAPTSSLLDCKHPSKCSQDPGEPSCCHTGIEQPAGPTTSQQSVLWSRLSGALATIVAIAPWTFLAATVQSSPPLAAPLGAILLYLALGATSLRQHAQAVSAALADDNIEQARQRVSQIVSRDTTNLTAKEIVKATIESVLENGNDAVFAPVFWFIVLGAPGVVLYRLSNTLDAMWGYKNERYLHFGWAAARLDDLLNWIPARLTALTYMLLGKVATAWNCWMTQGHLWYSPNAGPVMSAGAGALEVELGGPAIYHGKIKDRPVLGKGRSPEPGDIDSAVKLVSNGLWLWTFILLMAGILHA